jgi:hypothetical protein
MEYEAMPGVGAFFAVVAADEASQSGHVDSVEHQPLLPSPSPAQNSSPIPLAHENYVHQAKSS